MVPYCNLKTFLVLPELPHGSPWEYNLQRLQFVFFFTLNVILKVTW